MSVPPTDKGIVYYLSSPYTHSDPEVVNKRYERVLEIAVQLMSAYYLIEPIAMSHEKSKRFELPTNYEFWKELNENWILKSDGVIVCMMDGWKESKGVQDEISFAKEQGLPVYYLKCNDDKCIFVDYVDYEEYIEPCAIKFVYTVVNEDVYLAYSTVSIVKFRNWIEEKSYDYAKNVYNKGGYDDIDGGLTKLDAIKKFLHYFGKFFKMEIEKDYSFGDSAIESHAKPLTVEQIFPNMAYLSTHFVDF